MSGGGTWSNLRSKFRTSERCVEASCSDTKAAAAAPGAGAPPPDRAEIGRATWRYLHAMAASYPAKPAAEEQAGAQQWLLSFLRLYPCSHCAEGFMDVCEAMPPTMGSRNEYALWWCEAHNKVSVDHVGNEPRRCDLAQLVSDATRSGMTLDELSSRSAVALSAE